MANVKIRHLSKDQTWHTANATWIPELGRIVILTGANPLLFKIGDGTTQLQNLDWSNGTKTLAQTLLQGNKVNELTIESNNSASVLRLKNTFTQLSFDNGSVAGYFYMDDSEMDINHDIAINLTAPSVTIAGYPIATQSFVDARIQSNIKIIGDWDATSGSMPLDDESNTTPFITQWGATIKQGWAFRVGYGQAGTVGGYDYEEGDVVYALMDNAGATPADWGDLDHNLQQATESLRGTAKVVTNAIIDDETTTDNERFLTANKFWSRAIPRFLNLAWTFAAKITFTTAPRFSSTTANQRLEVDANKDLISVAKGTADNKDFGTGSGTVCEGNDSRLSDTRYNKCPFKQNTTISHTGTASNTKVYSALIPAGTFSANDIFRWMLQIGATSNANTKTFRYYFNTSDSLTGATLVGTYALSSGAVLVGSDRLMTFKNSLSSQEIGLVSSSFQSQFSASSSAPSSLSIDFSVDQYFIVAIQLANTGDTAKIFSISSELYR